MKITEKMWDKVARNFVSAGGLPIPVSDTLIELFQVLISEEQAKFLQKFRKRSLTFDQIKTRTDLDDKALDEMLNGLMDNGVIIGLPSSRDGVMVYSLVSILPGLIEFPFMRGEKGEKQKKLARLMDEILDELSRLTQSNYNLVMEQFKSDNPIDRVVPVEKEVEANLDVVLPFEVCKSIIERNDLISVNYCYCRNWKDNLQDPCKLESPKLSCFQFGRYAKFLIDHNFGWPISKEEAMKILKEAEDDGLIHKAIHLKNPEQEEQAFCNCCNCCCQFFQLYKRGIIPFHTITYYIANLDQEKCRGCGICVEKCPIDAIELSETLSFTNLDRCIGCGLCAYHCPEKARNLERTGLRRIFIPPPHIIQIDQS
ncbi:MAG: ATP-binding protein [Promethearchaeota archaeon]|jgi:ferredoxin